MKTPATVPPTAPPARWRASVFVFAPTWTKGPIRLIIDSPQGLAADERATTTPKAVIATSGTVIGRGSRAAPADDRRRALAAGADEAVAAATGAVALGATDPAAGRRAAAVPLAEGDAPASAAPA